MEGVFAMGDAAVDPEKPLGPLAQVADQQGKVREHILLCSRRLTCDTTHVGNIYCPDMLFLPPVRVSVATRVLLPYLHQACFGDMDCALTPRKAEILR